MKACKKWWSRQGSRRQKLSISMSNPGGKTYQEGTEEGWRAALEWFKETMNEITDNDIAISGQEVIDSELEDL